jgi:predicted transcriptional regulator
MATVKEDVLRLIKGLPDNCTLADVKERIDPCEKVAEGLADVEEGRILTQDQAEQEVAKWLRSSGRSPA